MDELTIHRNSTVKKRDTDLLKNKHAHVFLKRKLLLLQLQPSDLLCRAQDALGRDKRIALEHLFVHDGKLSPKRVFAIEHHACEQVQRQEQGLR